MAVPPPGSVDPVDLSDLGAEEAPVRGRGPRIARVAVVVTCVFILGMWIFVYAYGAVHKPVDKLASPEFGRRAEPICAVTAAQMAALPKAFETTTNGERADVVAQTNQDLRTMLAKLATVAPTSGNDARIVHEWLSDYSTYVGNREDYARRLRTDPGARFYEAEKQGDQITDPVDTLATVNHMNDCVAPEDLS